jgi:hypothetical protein
MVFQIAKQIMARISNGQSLGIFNSNPTIIIIEPRVSATERLCSLYKTEGRRKRAEGRRKMDL